VTRRLDQTAAEISACCACLQLHGNNSSVFDPRETRGHLVEFVRDAQRLLTRQLGPPPIPYLP
jgi:hypothetical protein